jgi:hypothetical protein
MYVHFVFCPRHFSQPYCCNCLEATDSCTYDVMWFYKSYTCSLKPAYCHSLIPLPLTLCLPLSVCLSVCLSVLSVSVSVSVFFFSSSLHAAPPPPFLCLPCPVFGVRVYVRASTSDQLGRIGNSLSCLLCLPQSCHSDPSRNILTVVDSFRN